LVRPQKQNLLHYNLNRYYDPETGRYVTADPIGLAGGINLFLYTKNSPVNFIDPKGLKVSLCARKLGDRFQPQVRPSGNPLRHDYLLIDTRARSFQAGEDGIFDSQGWVDNDEMDFNPKCELICEDPAFDKYVLDAANYTPRYNIAAYPGTMAYSLGYRNCQSWAREVLEKAKQEYLDNENCPKCFN